MNLFIPADWTLRLQTYSKKLKCKLYLSDWAWVYFNLCWQDDIFIFFSMFDAQKKLKVWIHQNQNFIPETIS